MEHTYNLKLYIVFIIPFCIISSLSAQRKSEIEINKNAIYIDGESIIFIGNVTINYERVLNHGGKTHFGISVGIGPGYAIASGNTEHEPSFYVPSGIVYKIKTNIFWKSGFEISLGYSLMDYRYPGTVYAGRVFEPYDEHIHYPIVGIGYRSVGRPFLFKFHIGTWGLGLGFGYSF